MKNTDTVVAGMTVRLTARLLEFVPAKQRKTFRARRFVVVHVDDGTGTARVIDSATCATHTFHASNLQEIR